SAWLGDEADIAAVLSGLAGRDALRGMLARLQPKEEALLLGWGVSMPILVRSRRYDNRLFEEIRGGQPPARGAEDAIRELFGE
ncbi:MAG: ATPase, partial [Chloroflexota bacterium]